MREARNDWIAEAQARLDEQLDQEELDRIQTEASERLEQLRDEIDALNDALHVDIGDVDLPEAVIPEPEVDGASNGTPLISSAWGWIEQTVALKESKGY